MIGNFGPDTLTLLFGQSSGIFHAFAHFFLSRNMSKHKNV